MPENVYIVEFIKLESGRLEFTNDYDKSLIKKVIKDATIGEKCKVTFDFSKEDGKYFQLKRLHGIIGDIAKETGAEFDEIKKEIKRRAGLYSPDDKLTSFANCSFEALQNAIKSGIELGEYLGMNIK